MKPKVVIIDMDGTLVDSEAYMTEAAIAMFKEHQVDVQPDDFNPFKGMGEDRYLGGVAEKYQLNLDLKEAKKRTYEIFKDLVKGKLNFYKGADFLIDRIKEEEIKIALATSADRAKVDITLEEIGIPQDKWDLIATSEDVQFPKPAPDLFMHCARTLKASTEECTVIEDSPAGVEAAKLANMYCIGVLNTHSEEDLFKADDKVINLLNIRISTLSRK